MKNYVQPGNTITLTAPYAVASGDGLLVGAIFGIGFPPVHGGALQYVNGYVAANGEIGIKAFTERAQELAEKYGERFAPPQLMRDMVARGELGRKSGKGFFDYR